MTVDLKTVAPDIIEAVRNEEQAKIISIFRYAQAAFLAFFSLYAVIYMVLGFAMVIAPQGFSEGQHTSGAESEGLQIAGSVVLIIGIVIFVFFVLLALGTLLAAIYMPKRKHYWLCFTVSCLECLFFPYGTLLGVLSLISLTKDSVKAAFRDAK